MVRKKESFTITVDMTAAQYVIVCAFTLFVIIVCASFIHIGLPRKLEALFFGIMFLFSGLALFLSRINLKNLE